MLKNFCERKHSIHMPAPQGFPLCSSVGAALEHCGRYSAGGEHARECGVGNLNHSRWWIRAKAGRDPVLARCARHALAVTLPQWFPASSALPRAFARSALSIGQRIVFVTVAAVLAGIGSRLRDRPGGFVRQRALGFAVQTRRTDAPMKSGLGRDSGCLATFPSGRTPIDRGAVNGCRNCSDCKSSRDNSSRVPVRRRERRWPRNSRTRPEQDQPGHWRRPC